LLDSLLQETFFLFLNFLLMFVFDGISSQSGFSRLLYKLYFKTLPRPHCLIPETPGLENQRRPTWLALILLFFSRPMLAVWKRLASGILVGLVCDSLTGNIDYALLDRRP